MHYSVVAVNQRTDFASFVFVLFCFKLMTQPVSPSASRARLLHVAGTLTHVHAPARARETPKIWRYRCWPIGASCLQRVAGDVTRRGERARARRKIEDEQASWPRALSLFGRQEPPVASGWRSRNPDTGRTVARASFRLGSPPESRFVKVGGAVFPPNPSPGLPAAVERVSQDERVREDVRTTSRFLGGWPGH